MKKTFAPGTTANLISIDGTRVSRVEVTGVTQTSDSVLQANGVKVKYLDGSDHEEYVFFSSKRLIRIKDGYDTLGVLKDISHLGNTDENMSSC